MSVTTTILLGVDTEADDQWTASGRTRLSVDNVHELPRLQELCDHYGVPPTYLVTHEMATDDAAKGVLRELAASGRCEIGTHHHPWSTPPLVEEHLYPLNLEPAHFAEQLKVLTEAVTAITGEAPVSYRSGRNGFAGYHVPRLVELGYRVDSSVDPFFNERRKGGPSFAGAPITPYFVDTEDPRLPGESDLLELPVTSALDRKWPHWLETAYADVTNAYRFRRALRLMRVARPIWLRPSYSKPADMMALGRRVLREGLPLANIIFHSSELLPGGSPYNETREDVDRFYRDLEALLALLTEGGAVGGTFRSFRDAWDRGARP